MVFFSCGECGESLKKNAVEKHYMTKCRSCNVLSCIDCQKDFWGDAYKEHTKCISEDEKYSGKNYKPKPGANKGEAKQDAWMNQVQQAIQKAPNNPKIRAVLQRIGEHSNVPRKKAKFENFVTNSMRVRDRNLVSQAWEYISAELNKAPVNENDKPTNGSESKQSEKQETVLNESNECEKQLSKREKKELRRQKQDKQEKKDKKSQHEEENGSDEVVKKKKKSKSKENKMGVEDENKKRKKKRKRDEDESDAEEQPEETPKKKLKKDKSEEQEDGDDSQEEEAEVAVKGKFKWEAAIIGALLAADDKTLSIKKLRKKVMAEYASRETGEGQSEEKLLAKFNKKISKNPRLKVHKDRVKLLR